MKASMGVSIYLQIKKELVYTEKLLKLTFNLFVERRPPYI